MTFEKTEKQKAFDYISDIVQQNIRIINGLSESPKRIDVIENGWGKRYIALEDVYKLLDNRFEEHLWLD